MNVLPDIEAYEVVEGPNVVPPYQHAHIGDYDVLEAPHDGGGECGVVLRAQHHGIAQHEAHHAGEAELPHEKGIAPLIVFVRLKHRDNNASYNQRMDVASGCPQSWAVFKYIVFKYCI